MMFSKPEIVVPNDVLARIEKTMLQAPGLMGTAYDRAVRRLRQQVVKELATEPPRTTGKRQWQSERQRKAFFASNGFGRGIPTIRTHTLSKGWKTDLKTTREGGIFTVFNGVPYRRFVQGIQAQRMHIQSGWKQEAQIIPKYQQQAQVILRETWRTVSSPTAGVKR